MILPKWRTWRTILFSVFVFIFIFNSLHVSSTSCSSSGETNCVYTASGNCHSVSVAVSCVGRKWTSDLHTTRPHIEKNCASRWSFIKNHYMMHGQQNIKYEKYRKIYELNSNLYIRTWGVIRKPHTAQIILTSVWTTVGLFLPYI